MANVQITQLPAASTLTGTEAVPIVQNGVTVQTTTGAITSSPALTYTFIVSGSTTGLSNARYLASGTGVGLTDGGAQGPYTISLNGASGSLEASGTGMIAKTSGTTVVPRTISISGNGLNIANGNGVSGNPTISLNGIVASLAGVSGTGILSTTGSSISTFTMAGTTSQITIANPNGVGTPTFALASNPILPGNQSVIIPAGTTAQQGTGQNGMIRFNTDNTVFEGYSGGTWRTFSLSGGVVTFSAGTTGLSPSTPTNGNIVLSGTLNAANGGTGASTLTGYVYGNGTGVMTASTTVPTTSLSGTVSNAQLANSSITINGNTVSLGGSTTVTAVTTSALTIGTGLSGTSFNGSTPVTIAIDSTVATLTGTQTLTNKTISGASNTLSNIGNSSLTNSSVTIGTTAIALGATSLTLGGLTTVTVTQDPTQALQLTTKQYVDAAISNVNYHAACSYATTADLGAVTYNNGSSGVGATITKTTPFATLAIDGGSPSVGQRILVKNETSGQYNGIYTVTSVGSGSVGWVLTRATDYDQVGVGANEIAPGDTTFIIAGTVNAGTQWVQTTDSPITIGTTILTFVQIAGPGSYTAGTGLTLTGTQFSLTSPVVVSLGGTGVTTLSGLAYGNGTSAFTAATAAQVVATISTTAVTNSTNTTNILGGATGSVPYNSASGTTTFLALGTSGYVLTAGASAPAYVAQSTLSVGTATNATNVALTAGSGATNYLHFSASATGNQPVNTNTSLTYNYTNNAITSGINGGTF